MPGTDGARHLVYAIVVENGPRARVRLDRLDVRDPDRGRSLGDCRGRPPADLVVRLDGHDRTRTISRRTIGLLLPDVLLTSPRPAPARLVNRLSMFLSDGRGETRRPS